MVVPQWREFAGKKDDTTQEGVICKRDCKLVIDALGWLDYYFSKERKLVVVVLSIAHHLPTKNYHPCLSPP